MMKLDDALKAARHELNSTAVPEQDSAVARAHMLAAYARARAEQAVLQRSPEARHQLLSELATSGAGSEGGTGGFWSGKQSWIISLFILVLAAVWLQSPVNISAREESMVPVSSANAAFASLSSQFMPLVDEATLSRVERGWVVPATLSVAELSSLGLPFDASRASELVNAEWLMSESGEVLGVRLLNASTMPSSSPASSLS